MLALYHCTIQANETTQHGLASGGFGGGIYSSGVLILEDTVVADNLCGLILKDTGEAYTTKVVPLSEAARYLKILQTLDALILPVMGVVYTIKVR